MTTREPHRDSSQARLAEDIFNTVADGAGRARAAETLTAAERQVGLAELHLDVMRFNVQHDTLLSSGYPAVTIGDWESAEDGPIPMLLLPVGLLGADMRILRHDYLGQHLNQLLSEHEGGAQPLEASPDEARKYFGHRVVSWLRSRLNGNLENETPKQVVAYGFTVRCERQDLRVFHSPAYAADTSRVFGSCLTSPVSSTLGPGRWIFGSAPLYSSDPRFELGEYSVPEVSSATLMGHHG